MLIDLRSDTVTKPTKEMLEHMASAPVGDDVYGEDPTMNKLEEMAARLFGMEKAIFCPSGTMTNQIGIKCHTQPGDEVICDELSHVYQYEGGGISFNSGASVRLLQGNRGRLNAKLVRESINNPDDIHKAISRLVVLENTGNKGGGSCYEWEDIVEIEAVCRQYGLAYHLDGARLFNALIAKDQDAASYGKLFNSISICLSKGLGAPVGSLLLGNTEFIKKARRIRKVMGGGMRQAGSLAAAGIFALENNIDRLRIDHAHAKAIETMLKGKAFITDILEVQTNIVIAEVSPDFDLKDFMKKMSEKGILFFSLSPNRFRMVTHLDISAQMIDKLQDTLTHF
ncbi:MAG: threonine aldolase family protein [bacterium]|jgi:threonine aldolase